MMKQRIVLLVGLTAVSLLILLTSCTQPAAPEPTTPPTMAPTAQPTVAPTPTPTLEPTPTPTYSQQANQLLLADGRFTTLLDKLTQEIGRELSDAEREQVMALARALWLPAPAAGLPDHLDENDWLPDPAGLTLHWRPNLDGREGPVLLVGEVQPDSPYAAGALIFWQAERLLSLTPGGPGYYFEFGRVQQNGWNFETWIEYDAEGNLHSFVHPDTMQYVTPQDNGTFYIVRELNQRHDPQSGKVYWENGGGSKEIPTGPDGTAMTQFLADNPDLQLRQTSHNGQQVTGLVDAQTQQLRYTLTFNPDNTIIWTQAEQPTLTERQFAPVPPLVFAINDSRGIVRELPSGVNPEYILSLGDLLEMARKNGIEPTHACSTEDGYAEPGYHQIVATIVGFDSYERTVMVGNRQVSTNQEGFWFQSCGLTKDDEGISRIVSIIFYAPFDGSFVNLVGDKPWEEWHMYRDIFNWDPETGTAKSTRISRTTLRDNVHDYLGSFAVMSRVPRFPDNYEGADIFAQLTHPGRNGFHYTPENTFDLGEASFTPFAGPVALIKQ